MESNSRSATNNNSSRTSSSKSYNSCSTATIVSRSSSSTTRKGAWVAISIAVVEIAYKLALIPLLLAETTLVLCLLLLCLFPMGVVVGLGFNLPILCLPYLLYNFLWTVVYGISAVFFLYQLVVMNSDYQHLVQKLLETLSSSQQPGITDMATIQNVHNVVYILTLVLLFVSIFGSLFALNIQNVVHQAYFNKKASIRAAKHIQAAVHLAGQRQHQQHYYSASTIPTLSLPRIQLPTNRLSTDRRVGGRNSAGGWAEPIISPAAQYPSLTTHMEDHASPTVSLV